MWEYTTPSHGLPIGAFFRGESARNAYRRNEDYSITKGNSTVVLGERLDRPGFRCLSAAGFRFSDPPLPAGELGLPHGRLTGGGAARPHRGFHVPHDGEAIGVGAFWTPGPWCSRWGQDTPQVKVAQYCRVIHRLRQPWLTTLQTKVPRVTRPIFTSPGLAGWFGIALGFSSCSAPDDYSSRTRRR